MTTDQRLEKLEQQNRWMRRIGAVGIAVVAAVFLLGQGGGKAKVPQDLVVRSLQVKDLKRGGHVRLDVDGLVIHDKAGLVPLVMLHGDGGLSVYDRNGRQALAVGVGKVGGVGKNVAGLFLLGEKNVRASLQVAADGSPALRLSDKDGRTRALLGVTEAVNKAGKKTKTAENTLTLYDAKGNVIWQTPR